MPKRTIIIDEEQLPDSIHGLALVQTKRIPDRRVIRGLMDRGMRVPGCRYSDEPPMPTGAAQTSLASQLSDLAAEANSPCEPEASNSLGVSSCAHAEPRGPLGDNGPRPF